MKKLKCTNVLITILALTMLSCTGLTLAGCAPESNPSTDNPIVVGQGDAEKVNSMIEALPQENAFKAADIPALEKVLEGYDALTDFEKSKVDYAKVEKLLAVPVYLDDTTKEYIPESTGQFALNPYLRGKTVTSVLLNGDRLLVGQYAVNGNAVVIEERYLKDCIPSVAEIEIYTDVSATYTYRVYAGMCGEETLFINADNKDVKNTALSLSDDGQFTFAVNKDEGFVYAVNFSYTDNSVNYDFEEGRRYNLYFDFSVPTHSESVSLPIYFEGIGGKLCTVDFLNGEPIVTDPTYEDGKKVAVSYIGDEVYRFYASFEAESNRLSLVIGLDGVATTIGIDNVWLYPTCGAPILRETAFEYDSSSATSLDIPVTPNGGELTEVSLAGNGTEYEYKNGVLKLPSSVLAGLKLSEAELVISNRYGTATASVSVYDGLPTVVGESVSFYTAGDDPVSFKVDLKGKTFKELRLNGGVVAKSVYTFDGESLTFTKNYLDELYSDNVFEMKFSDSGATLKLTIKTNYVYKSNFKKGTSDADLFFAPDGTGKVVYDDGKFWANYSNPVGGTVCILTANTFVFEEGKTYEITYNMKFGPSHSASWWSPVWLKGCHDLIYIKMQGKGVLTKDNVYPAGNPLDTDYSFINNGKYYEVSIVFTAKGKGIAKPYALEFASWDGAADVYYSDFSIAEYAEKIDVLLMGSDLISEGYWGGYKKDIALYETVNAGKIGSDISYWLNETGNLVRKYSPKKIVLSVGENDLYSGKTADTVIAEYKRLIGKIKEVYPKSQLFVLSMIKTVKYAGKNAEVEKINEALKDYVAEINYKFVDITGKIENSDGTPVQSLYLSDGIHIARNNYSKISSEILSGCSLDGSLDALFIGDSYMSVGYWHTYENDMSDINSVNLGVGGTTTIYWKEKVASLAEKYRASTIVIHIGVNDIDDTGADSATTASRIKALVNDLHAAFPDAEIKWMTISPNNMFASKNYMYPPVNAEMKAFAEVNEWFSVIDVAPYFTGEDGKYLSQYYLSEGMHLNVSGYEIFVREIRKALGI